MLMNVDVESYAGFEPASTRMKTLRPKPLDEYDMNLRMEPAVRIERTTSRLQGERCYQLSYAGAKVCPCYERWRAPKESNLQPPVLETGVLPVELGTQEAGGPPSKPRTCMTFVPGS
jgi:hypothetical protein